MPVEESLQRAPAPRPSRSAQPAYAFCSEWVVESPLDRVHAVLDDPTVWPLFWPSLTDVERVGARSEARVGRRFVLRWRAPGGYSLAHEVETTFADPPGVVELVSAGQLAGAGRWELDAVPGGTRARYHWHVDASRRWMSALRPLLADWFAQNHHALMAEGGRGLADYLGARLVAVRHHAGEHARRMWSRPSLAPPRREHTLAELGDAVSSASTQPRPAAPWVTLQRWRDLVLLHWRVAPEQLAPRLGGLEPEIVDGSAWVSLVCMRTPRIVTSGGLPLSAGDYAQVNVRTYVRHGGEPMVCFLHVGCGSRLVAEMVRRVGRMPYHAARVRLSREGGLHTYQHAGRGVLEVDVRPRGVSRPIDRAGLEGRLAERYASVCADGARTTVATLAHAPWEVCEADVGVRRNTMLGALPITGIDPLRPDLTTFSPGATAITWGPAELARSNRGSGLRVGAADEEIE